MDLREALHDVVFNSGMKPKELSDRLGISYSYLMNAVHPAFPKFQFQLRHLVPITRETGNFTAVDHIELCLGRVCFPIPRVTSADEVRVELMKALSDFWVLVSLGAVALKNGEMALDHAALIHGQCIHLVRQLLAFSAAVKEAAERGTR